MSEFTYGNIIRIVDMPKLLGILPIGTPTIKLNQNWCAFFTSEDGEFVASEQLKTLSIYCPILYFTNLEDHGWGFEVFQGGECISNLQVLYELLDGNFEEMMVEYDEVEAPILEGYMNQNPNAEAFRVFGLNDEQIKSIEELLIGHLGFDDDDEFVAVEKFKELLGIEEMNWIRHDRIDGREEIDYV